jgi:Ca-activated chloride channel family protein
VIEALPMTMPVPLTTLFAALPVAAQQAVRFGDGDRLWLLVLVPLILVLFIANRRARRQGRLRWAGSLFDRLAPGWDGGRERLKMILFTIAMGFVVLALARPQWGGETVMMKRQGIDLFIALDTSISMLAEDMRPNRLEQAKRAIADLVEKLGGDRVGLVAFAGEALTVCPLTLDHGTVLLLLESMGPTSVSKPGTNVAAAIQRARESFVAGERKHKALLLVTDGESHEGEVLAEAEKAAADGLVIYTIGIGSPDGEPIPQRDEAGRVTGYKKDRQGSVISTRLDQNTLQRVAAQTSGQYHRATPQGFELDAVYDDLQSMEKKELEGSLATSYEERFRWPLTLGLLLLVVELLLPVRRRQPEEVS